MTASGGSSGIYIRSVFGVNGAPRVWAEKYIFCAQNTDETATRL